MAILLFEGYIIVAIRILVVGAGFAGAVYARVAAEAGCHVDVIDKRPHIGGNAYDEVDANGVCVHAYGPHLFHTSNRDVFSWLKRFAEWVPYEHRVQARLPDGRLVPLPINLHTINQLYRLELQTEREVRAFLDSISLPNARPSNAAEYLYAHFGRDITDLFFRSYTRKMWGLELEAIDSSVVCRLPIRYDTENRYFPNDKFQAMPRGGFTTLFESIFEHAGIRVCLSTAFAPGMEADYQHVFNAMPVDEYFQYVLGELPYRSIRFHRHDIDNGRNEGAAVINYTDTGPFTRETSWHLIPQHVVRETGRRTVTVEEPCDYRDNNFERYYPVKTADGRFVALYQRYRMLADELPNMTFIGRCGTYQYLDMDQVINQSLKHAQTWLAKAG
jgi:UDP-galactopyranose mutase